jgi:hypothetical protein
MTEPERAALDHIRRVVDSVIGELPSPEIIPISRAAITTLPVPYVYQSIKEEGEVLDSGAAAGAMLTRAYAGKILTPSDFAKQAGQLSDAPLSLTQVSNALRLNGIAVELRSGLKLTDLAMILFSGRPPILLVNNEILQQSDWTKVEIKGPHFLVGVGMDVDKIYVHDPLHPGSTGECQALPWLVFYKSWTQAPDFERAALVPRQQLVRRVKVAASTLSIRQNPSNEETVGTVEAGEVFEITAQSDGWGKIGNDRWISLSYVTDI